MYRYNHRSASKIGDIESIIDSIQSRATQAKRAIQKLEQDPSKKTILVECMIHIQNLSEDAEKRINNVG